MVDTNPKYVEMVRREFGDEVVPPESGTKMEHIEIPSNVNTTKDATTEVRNKRYKASIYKSEMNLNMYCIRNYEISMGGINTTHEIGLYVYI